MKTLSALFFIVLFSAISAHLFAAPVYDLDTADGRYLSFDDYSLTTGTTPTWQHFGPTAPTPSARGLKAGTNHLHQSSWSFLHCRIGRSTYIENSVLPILNGNEYVPIGTNYCLYLQNTTNVLIHSPVFTTGIGTLYLDAISLNYLDINIAIYIATNMVNDLGAPVPIDESANSNRTAIVWEPAPLDIITLVGGDPEFAYKRELNIRQPVCIKIMRNNMYADYFSRDGYYAVIDNIRVSEPPADVVMDKSAMPFNVYPRVNQEMNIQFRIDNVPGPYTTVSTLRTNVLLVSRWNYLNQKTTPWTTNVMQCVNIGDGAGNNELWQPLPPLPSYPDAGDLEYFFLCHFDGAYYQSYDYTVYPKVLDPVLFPPENMSPRTYSADGVTHNSGTNAPFVFPLRLFPSEHDTVKTLLYVNGSETPMALPMTLVGTNRWQAKYDVINYLNVTNLLWYFESTGAFTNAYQVTQEKHYWHNVNHIQNRALPYGDICGVTDASLTNRPAEWFGVTITPGESSYVLFTLDTSKSNCLAGRGEYQNFNGWNTGAVAQNAFTDADDKWPKVSCSQNFSSGWRQSYFSGLSNWFGTITFAGKTASVRVGPEAILSQPLSWLAGSFQYVTERTAINGLVADAETTGQRRNQGIRLLGGSDGLGLGYYQGSLGQQNGINGVGTVTYKARLSRPIATDPDYNYNVAYRFRDMMRTNYVLKCYMNAVTATPEAPSISIIAYYQSPRKFYEYRIVQLPDARDINAPYGVYAGRDGYVAHQIWKWNGSNTPQLLAESKRVNTVTTAWGGTELAYDARVTTTQSNPTEFRLYTTLTPTPSVSLRVRFQNTDIPFPAGSTTFEVVDSTNPILFGGYGFHSADCTLFVNTMTLNKTLVGAIDGGGTPTVVIGGGSSNHATEWYWPAELYSLSGNTFAPAMQSANVQVLTGSSELGPWTPFRNQTVNSYAYQNFSATTNAWNNLCARIQANDRVGVVIDGVRVGSWRGENITSAPSDNWKITEGWLNYNVTDSWFAHLDASQANPSLIQSVRSERILGLGSISFDYRATLAPAQIKIQYTANAIPQDDSDTGWVDATNINIAATGSWTPSNIYLALAAATNIYVRIVNNTLTNRKATVDVRNIVIWNNPTNSPNDWAAYNMKISDTETDKLWLDKKTVSGTDPDKARSGYLNNSQTANIIPGRPMTQFNPYIMAPRLTSGLGTISFLARAFTTAYAAGNTNTSISVYASTDEWDKFKPDPLWTKLYTFTNITNAFYRPYTYTPHVPNDIKAMKLVVEGVTPPGGTPQRVCLDELVVTEGIFSRFDITDVKLLLSGTPTPLETKQPVEGEAIGVEARLCNFAFEPQDIKVWLSYVIGTNTWGVFNAPEEMRRTERLELIDPLNQLYRTPEAFSVTGIPAQEAHTVVQYLVWAEYADPVSGRACITNLSCSVEHPAWYPTNLNDSYAPAKSPYYIVGSTNAPLWLTPRLQNVPYTGGLFSAFVGARSNWLVSSSMPWLSPLASSGDAPAHTHYYVSPNPSVSSRSATLTYSSALLSETLVVNQDPAPSNFSATLDFAGFRWTLGGDHLWFSQTTVVKTGDSALQSGPISDNQTSWIETVVKGPSFLSFWWRVSSETDRDCLGVSVDGVPLSVISGASDWKKETLNIRAGEHVVRWSYTKNSSLHSGNDCGWLDGVEWVPPLQVTVSFDPTPGILETTNTLLYCVGYPYESLPVPSLDGYSFDGWFTQMGELTVPIHASTLAEEYVHNLFARWTPIPSPVGFTLWSETLGLHGNIYDLFLQDRNLDGIANGFEYAFGTNLPLSSLLLNIRFVNGKAIVEVPQQDAATLPYVDVRVRGSTNLLDWTLPMIPAIDTTGKPSYKSWHEPQGTTPAKAFFKLEAELK